MAQSPGGGMMDGLMAFFKPPAKATPATNNNPNANTNTNQNQNANANANANPNAMGVDKTANNGQNNNPEEFKNTLDVYAGLFDNEALNKDAAKPPSFTLSPDIISKAAGSLDFLPEELATKVQQGNLSPQDYMEMINHAGRQAYAKAMEHSSTLTDKFVAQRSAFEQQGLPKHLNNLLAKHKATSDPAALSNPVVKAHLEVISSQLASKFPDQTPEWIADKAKGFFLEMAKALNPNFGEGGEGGEGVQPKQPDMANFDWDGYIKS
jgi:hypothetical protein